MNATSATQPGATDESFDITIRQFPVIFSILTNTLLQIEEAIGIFEPEGQSRGRDVEMFCGCMRREIEECRSRFNLPRTPAPPVTASHDEIRAMLAGRSEFRHELAQMPTMITVAADELLEKTMNDPMRFSAEERTAAQVLCNTIDEFTSLIWQLRLEAA